MRRQNKQPGYGLLENCLLAICAYERVLEGDLRTLCAILPDWLGNQKILPHQWRCVWAFEGAVVFFVPTEKESTFGAVITRMPLEPASNL